MPAPWVLHGGDEGGAQDPASHAVNQMARAEIIRGGTHTNLSALVNGGHDGSDRDGSVGVVVAETSEEDGVAELGGTPFMPRAKKSQQAAEVVAPARDFR